MIMTKEELALVIIDRLKKEYPDAGCTLDYNQAWKLLVSVRLAAQCTDARVNIVVEDLYKKFPDVNSLADAPVEEIEAIVKPCGLGHSKARDIKACMTRLKEDYNGNVPDDFNALLKLPGVGRKSANLIMGDVFGKPAIVTDTHCIRLVNRMGLVDGIKEPKKVEMALWKLVPPECAPYTLRRTSSSTVILSIGDPEVLHDRFELILCGQAGIQQVTAFRLPRMETAVVEHLEVIRDNERHDVVPQTLFEEKKPPDPSVSILKRMDGFKGIVKFQQILQVFLRGAAVCG